MAILTNRKKKTKGDPPKKKTKAVKTTKGRTIMSTPNSPNAKLERTVGAVPENWTSKKPKSKLTLRQKMEKQTLKKRGSIKKGQNWTGY